jgi:hypothetical protein
MTRDTSTQADLLAACCALVQAARDAHEHWDADRDMKVGKLLMAMAGRLPGYRPNLDVAHAAIARAEGRPAPEARPQE